MTTFGHYTTAREVLQGLDLIGKVALVTGGNAGEATNHEASRACNLRRDYLLSEHKHRPQVCFGQPPPQVMLLQALAQRQWMLWHVLDVMCCSRQGPSALM